MTREQAEKLADFIIVRTGLHVLSWFNSKALVDTILEFFQEAEQS
jgi:hypothetical protein